MDAKRIKLFTFYKGIDPSLFNGNLPQPLLKEHVNFLEHGVEIEYAIERGKAPKKCWCFSGYAGLLPFTIHSILKKATDLFSVTKCNSIGGLIYKGTLFEGTLFIRYDPSGEKTYQSFSSDTNTISMTTRFHLAFYDPVEIF